MNYKDFIRSNDQEIISKLKNEIEKLDLELNAKRNKKTHQISARRSRTVLTRYGNLTYKRYVYKYYNKQTGKKEYVTFVDEKIGVTKNKKLQDCLVDEILDQLPKGKRYRDILDMFPSIHLSTMTISRLFKKAAIVKNSKKIDKIQLADKQRLFINLDDAFVPVIKKNRRVKERIRIFSFYTDKKKIFPTRNKLINKRVCYITTDENTSIDTTSFSDQVAQMGRQFYDNFDNAKLVVGGDGAHWIKNVASNLGGTYVLDKFHAVKCLHDEFLRGRKRYTKDNWVLFQSCRNFLEIGEIEKLLDVLRIFATKKTYTYFNSNRRGLEPYTEDWSHGVSAESDVVRFKSLLGHGAKIFNWRVYNNMLAVRANSINTIGGF